jgi:hypothetical protein
MSTLLRLLLNEVGEPHYRTAKAVGISPSSMSRLIAGTSARKSSLKKLERYFSTKYETAVDADVLSQEVSARSLIAGALFLRGEELKSPQRQKVTP